MVRAVRRWLTRWSARDRLSADWLRHQDRQETRVEFHGVRWRWPVNKRVNESAAFNRWRLRRSA